MSRIDEKIDKYLGEASDTEFDRIVVSVKAKNNKSAEAEAKKVLKNKVKGKYSYRTIESDNMKGDDWICMIQ